MVERGHNEIHEPLSPPKGGYPQDVNYQTQDTSLQPDSRDGSSENPGLHNYDVAEDDTLKSRIVEWAKKSYREQKHAARNRAFKDWLAVFLPCFGWLTTYNIKEYLPLDLMAGVSIAFMVVPQGMSYAVLAGLPPVYGLYGAFVPVLIYSAFGSSKHLAVGPVAVTSLLLGQALRRMFPEAEGIEDAANPGESLAKVQNDINIAAIQITLMVGILYSCIGIFQLTFLANFLSHSVISGFTTGAACIIGLSQMKYIFGVKVGKTNTALETIIELIKALPETQWREFVMGITWLIALTGMKHVSKSYPKFSWLRPLGPITVVTIAILAVVIGKLDTKLDTEGNELIKTVQYVPKGMPPVTVTDWFPINKFSEQLQIAIILCLVDFMESTSIAKAVARKHKYEINVNQEILAMGLANIIGSMFSSYTTTGSFSRSAVCSEIGAKRQLAGTITGVCVMLVLLFITPVFERVPYNAMGAIVLSSVLGLLEISEAIFLFKANFLDFLVWISAFLGTIFLGVEIGLLIAIGLAVVLVVYQSAFPHTAVLGNLPGTEVYRNKKQYPSAKEHPHLCIVRIDAPIYFANTEWIRGRIDKYRMRADKEVGPVFYVILDMSPVPFVDSNGMHALHELVSQLHSDGQQLVLANPSRKVRSQLKRVDLWKEIGEEWVFVRTADAVKMCQASVQTKLAEAKNDCDIDIGVGV